jgi:hypothetical protein
MTALEKLQFESRERRRLMGQLKQLTKEKKKLEAKLLIEEIPEPEYLKTVPIKKERKPRKQKAPKIIPPDPEIIREYIREKTAPKVDLGKVKKFNEHKTYESAFTYKEDALRPPAKYSNRRAIDDYDF